MNLVELCLFFLSEFILLLGRVLARGPTRFLRESLSASEGAVCKLEVVVHYSPVLMGSLLACTRVIRLGLGAGRVYRDGPAAISRGAS